MALRQVYDDNGTLKSKDIAGSGSANAADTAYDNSTTGLPANVQGAIDKTTGNISSLGTVELTSTAAHAHAAGSTFLWIGQLVKATAAIAVGDTIAVGTNVANTDICSVLDELDSGLTYINIILDGKQDALTNPLTQADVVNNLTSTATNLPLSAAMGKALQSKINQRFQKTLATNPNGIIDLLQDQDWVNFYDITTMYIIFALPLGTDIYAVVGSRSPSGYPWIKVMNYDNTPFANSSVNIIIYCNRI